MTNKKKQNPTQRAVKSERIPPKPKKRAKYVFLALALGIASLVTGTYLLFQRGPSLKSAPESVKLEKENVRLRENRPTLAPESFTGQIRQAYEIARTIPEVLDQLYCHCQCQDIGHKSLLSCYVDDHAAA